MRLQRSINQKCSRNTSRRRRVSDVSHQRCCLRAHHARCSLRRLLLRRLRRRARLLRLLLRALRTAGASHTPAPFICGCGPPRASPAAFGSLAPRRGAQVSSQAGERASCAFRVFPCPSIIRQREPAQPTTSPRIRERPKRPHRAPSLPAFIIEIHVTSTEETLALTGNLHVCI